MNNVALCMHQSMVFHSGVIKTNDGIVALCTYGFSIQFIWCSTMPWLSVRQKWQVVTLETQRLSQAQLVVDIRTTQSNMSKLLKKHRITGEVKAQLKKLHQ